MFQTRQSFIKRVSAEGDEELNIMPVLDILSTLVVFLLIVAVWFQPGVLDISSMFGQKNQDQKTPRTIVVHIKRNGTTEISLLGITDKSLPKHRPIYQNLQQLTTAFEVLKKNGFAEVRVTAEPRAQYKQVVNVMDKAHSIGFQKIQLESSL